MSKVSQDIIKKIEQAQLKTDVPAFGPGDTVIVRVRVKEGEKERLQAYEGVVIAKHKSSNNLDSTITVRKMFQGGGIEKVFVLNSPWIKTVKILRRAKVKRAKLYYLRERTGKSARLKTKF